MALEEQNQPSPPNPQEPTAIIPDSASKKKTDIKKIGAFVGFFLILASLIGSIFLVKQRQEIRNLATEIAGPWECRVSQGGNRELCLAWLEANGWPCQAGDDYQSCTCSTGCENTCCALWPDDPECLCEVTPTPTTTLIPSPTPTPPEQESCPTCEELTGQPSVDEQTWEIRIKDTVPTGQHTFTRPTNSNYVIVNSYWQWDGSPGQNQKNEIHELITPLGTVNCPDFGNEELEGQEFCCGSLSGAYTETDLSVTVNFTGDNSSPGSHWARVKVNWCEEPPTQTPSPTPSTTPSPPPTPTVPPSASCDWIRAYDDKWYLITDFSTLKAQDQIYLGVRGSFSQGEIEGARFRVNGGEWMTTSEQKTLEEETFYYLAYTIPEKTYHFRIEAEIRHSSLGWL